MSQRQPAVKLYRVFASPWGSPDSALERTFHRARRWDSGALVYPFMQAATESARYYAHAVTFVRRLLTSIKSRRTAAKQSLHVAVKVGPSLHPGWGVRRTVSGDSRYERVTLSFIVEARRAIWSKPGFVTTKPDTQLGSSLSCWLSAPITLSP